MQARPLLFVQILAPLAALFPMDDFLNVRARASVGFALQYHHWTLRTNTRNAYMFIPVCPNVLLDGILHPKPLIKSTANY